MSKSADGHKANPSHRNRNQDLNGHTGKKIEEDGQGD